MRADVRELHERHGCGCGLWMGSLARWEARAGATSTGTRWMVEKLCGVLIGAYVEEISDNRVVNKRWR